MKSNILTLFLVMGATLLQAQSITVHQTCGQNGQVVKAIPPEAAQAVDLGLSVKWANMNVGAESPEDYGNYYAWGETATKETYDWSTYFDTNDEGETFAKYNNDGGKTVLDPEDDAAHVNWGGSWRMPMEAEWQELIDNCTWTWTTQNGINGCKVTSNKEGYTDVSIFIPAAGYRSEKGLFSYYSKEGDLFNAGSNAYYWSSSLYSLASYSAGSLGFYSEKHDFYVYPRELGQQVRPVLPPSTTLAKNTDNPRTITTNGNADYTAYFEYDKVGTCGKDYALTWEYNTSSKTLTISGNGSFDENMECGLQAKQEMTKLIINEGVTAIGKEAFSNCANLTTMQLPTTLKIIGERAFYYCLDLVAIYNYRVNPCLIETNTFEKVNTFDCVLYVLTNSIAKYKSDASGWKIFYYINPVDATTVNNQVTDVTVVPSDNNAVVTWPISENAATYTLRITKDDEAFCTLFFNAKGQLTDKAFAPGRNGNRHAPQAVMTANGLQFTVTGLNSATHYALTLQAKDDQDAVLASYSSEFTTTGTATAVEDVQSDNVQCIKVVHDGKIFILRGNNTYTLTGQKVK